MSPTMDRVGGGPKSVALGITLGFTSQDSDQLPATLAKAELKFTRGAVVNGRWFPKCDPKKLRARKRCPRARCSAARRSGRQSAQRCRQGWRAAHGFAATVTGKVRHKGRRRGYIETSLCPPGAQVPLLGNFTFRDGVVKNDKTTIVCGGVLP